MYDRPFKKYNLSDVDFTKFYHEQLLVSLILFKILP